MQLNHRAHSWPSGDMDKGFVLLHCQTDVCIEHDKTVLQTYLMIQRTPPADVAMMSAYKHHKHVQPCCLSLSSIFSSHIFYV